MFLILINVRKNYFICYFTLHFIIQFFTAALYKISISEGENVSFSCEGTFYY